METTLFILCFCLFSAALFLLWILQKGQQNKGSILCEDILKEFFFDEDLEKETSIESLSSHLKVSKRRIKRVLKVLEKRGLIISSSGKLHLLKAGRDYALGLIRKHRLYEKYLAEHTGYGKSE